MWTLLKKEISGFLSSLTGYIVIVVFLITNGTYLWLFRGDQNVLDTGYANLDTLFIISPVVFLFLVPAVTMRMFADENRSGTMEQLLTRPLSEFTVIIAKYLAGLMLVLFALLPTLVYFLSVYLMGDPVGSIDTGGVWGSYIGLFFLAAVYVSIGIFASSLTQNQIVSFIIAVVISFILYLGFDTLGMLAVFKHIEGLIRYLGINQHYVSMSRGMIDTRDVIYFVSVIATFLFLTKARLESRKW